VGVRSARRDRRRRAPARRGRRRRRGLALRRPTLDDVFLALTGHAARKPDDEDDRAAA
jgi:hypothetical protein